MPKIVDRTIFVNAALDLFGADTVSLTREQVLKVCELRNLGYPAWLTNDPANRVGRGVYRLPVE